MDTFFEQIVAIRKTEKTLFAVIGIWLLAVLLAAFILLLGLSFSPAIALLLVCGIFYGTYKLTGRFSIEYEYIITNGTMDVDKIVSKSSRKRVLSFELQTVSRLEKFQSAQLNSINSKDLTVACNLNDPDAYLMVAENEGKGSVFLVFAPDERIRGAIVKFIPKFLANHAFQ